MAINDTRILIIDDDQNFAAWLKETLINLCRVDLGYTEEDFFKLFCPHKYELLILDMKIKTSKEGLTLLKYAKEEEPTLPILIITGYGTIDTAVEAFQAGAKSFIQKDKIKREKKELLSIVKQCLEERRAQKRIEILLKERKKAIIIGESTSIREVLELCQIAAKDGMSNVLIRGETGTGKELVARYIHEIGMRKEGPFVSVAIPALNKETIVSELFGHEKGAFTGADNKHIGYFEQAHEGILFLDEIGDLSYEAQKMLLRVIETNVFRRVGGKKDIKVNVQIITATNRPLEEMIEKGIFRPDLYYRLKVIEIVLPPLKERKEDIPLLANYFLKELYHKGRSTAKKFSDEVLNRFLSYSWPGNIRELKHIIEFSALRARLDHSETITMRYLPSEFEAPGKNIFQKKNIDMILAETELSYVQMAMEKTNWHKVKAAELLGYPNRYAFRRRILKILSKYPELGASFPEIKKKYY